MSNVRTEGLAILLKRRDGVTFLASAGTGIAPVVFAKQQRKAANAHRRELAEHGMPGKVVAVRIEVTVIDDHDEDSAS